MRFDEVVEFVENFEFCCFCVLLLDILVLMIGIFIQVLNDGLEIFKDNLIIDELVKK